MDNTKIIFFDIDGTLIDIEKKCVTEKMLETLRRLQEKGIGVNKVLEYYGIDKSQAMAFGDGNNDIEINLKIKWRITTNGFWCEIKENVLKC